jgi:putative Mg2+ transporter-C (MgtC) family protein
MISTAEIITRIVIGAILGGIIGFERHVHGRAAGFRTHLLVCMAMVLIMIVSEYYHHLSVWDSSYVRVDPIRLAAGAITGIGFIGAGVIVKIGFNVQGLTTAACLWIVAAIGLAIGSGLYAAGVVSFGITLLALWLMRVVEETMPGLAYRYMTIVMEGTGDENALTSTVRQCGAAISRLDYGRDLERKELTFDLTISFRDETCPRRILDGISALQAVKKVSIRS